jgi:predicted nucleic acid-binding protein
MTETFFVDTNVLVYARDASEAEKQPDAEAWMHHLWRERTGRLSYQVLQEFYVTVTGKLDPGMDPGEAREEVRSLLVWRPLTMNQRVLETAWRIQDRYRLAWWDSLIVAEARAAGCRYLLTEDLQHHQALGDLTVLSPFEISPDTLPRG